MLAPRCAPHSKHPELTCIPIQASQALHVARCSEEGLTSTFSLSWKATQEGTSPSAMRSPFRPGTSLSCTHKRSSCWSFVFYLLPNAPP